MSKNDINKKSNQRYNENNFKNNLVDKVYNLELIINNLLIENAILNKKINKLELMIKNIRKYEEQNSSNDIDEEFDNYEETKKKKNNEKIEINTNDDFGGKIIFFKGDNKNLDKNENNTNNKKNAELSIDELKKQIQKNIKKN